MSPPFKTLIIMKKNPKITEEKQKQIWMMPLINLLIPSHCFALPSATGTQFHAPSKFHLFYFIYHCPSGFDWKRKSPEGSNLM